MRVLLMGAAMLGMAVSVWAAEPQKGTAQRLDAKTPATQPSAEPAALMKILKKLPKELLPAQDDKTNVLEEKDGFLQEWNRKNVRLDFGGTLMRMPAKFEKLTLLDIKEDANVPPPGAPIGASPGAAPGGKGKRQFLYFSFTQEIEFEGVPLQVKFTVDKTIFTETDPMLVLARSCEKLGKDVTFDVAAKVTQIHMTVMPDMQLRMLPRGRGIPAKPKLVVSCVAGNGEIAAKVKK